MRLRFRTLQHPPAPKCFPPLWLQSRDVNFIAWKCLPLPFRSAKSLATFDVKFVEIWCANKVLCSSDCSLPFIGISNPVYD